jgi:hypothetical protein
VQYRERSAAVPHSFSAVLLSIVLLSVASDRFARATVLVASYFCANYGEIASFWDQSAKIKQQRTTEAAFCHIIFAK